MEYFVSAVRSDYFPAKYIDQSPQSLATFYLNQIANMPYVSRADKYHLFIRKFGTHLARWSRLGGVVKNWEFTSSSYFEESGYESTKQEATLGFKSFLSIKGASTVTSETQSTAFKLNSDTRRV
jgi:hypothetical protein